MLAALTVEAGCAAAPTHSVITTGSDRLRTFSVMHELNGNPVTCPAFALSDPVAGRLQGDANDPLEPIWLVTSDVRRLSVVWPGGFTVRLPPDVALVNDHGEVVARIGDWFELSQVRPDDAAGSFDDPYIAAGALFDDCYPYIK